MDVRQVTIFLFFYLMKQLKELFGNGFIEFRTEFISFWAFLCWEALLWLQSHCYETVQVVDTSWFNIYMSKVSRKLYSSSKFLRFYFNVIFFSDCLYFIGIYNNLIFMLILQILSILLLAGLAKYLSSLFTFSKFNSFFIECMYCSFTFHFNCCSDVHYFLLSTSLGFVFLRPWNASLRHLFEIFLLKI